MSRNKITVTVAAAFALGVMALLGPVNDPALPEIVYGPDGAPYTQSGERIEEDDPRWECTRDDDRAHCDN